MKNFFLLVVLLATTTRIFAQQTAVDSVKLTVSSTFDAMRKGDSTLMKTYFAKDMLLQSVETGRDGKSILLTEKTHDFVTAIGSPHPVVYDERTGAYDIKIDRDLASVWVPYKFYLGDKFSHCGVDIIQLMRTDEGWKIIYIVDTERKDYCID
jgi:hypothetical protein